jgi:3-hydroxyisobutyrate dehydrogenase
VGGSAAALEHARPVLAAMSRDVLHLGPSGSGAQLKLVNNFLCGVQAAALAEGIALIERCGINRDAALSMLTKGAPGSPLVGSVSARMAKPDYAVNFAMTLMHKDLSYAMAEAKRRGLDLTTATTARAAFTRAMEAGWGDQDFAAVIEPLRAQQT